MIVNISLYKVVSGDVSSSMSFSVCSDSSLVGNVPSPSTTPSAISVNREKKHFILRTSRDFYLTYESLNVV